MCPLAAELPNLQWHCTNGVTAFPHSTSENPSMPQITLTLLGIWGGNASLNAAKMCKIPQSHYSDMECPHQFFHQVSVLFVQAFHPIPQGLRSCSGRTMKGSPPAFFLEAVTRPHMRRIAPLFLPEWPFGLAPVGGGAEKPCNPGACDPSTPSRLPPPKPTPPPPPKRQHGIIDL